MLDYQTILKELKNNVHYFFEVPREFLTEELCLEVIKQEPVLFKFIPIKCRTYKQYLTLYERKYNFPLEEVPNDFINYELCLQAVSVNGYNLQFVPKENIDYSICLKAVRQNGSSLKFVPKYFLNEELCSEAVKNSHSVIDDIPNYFMTDDLCLKLTMDYPMEIYNVLKKDVTPSYSVILQAIKNGCPLDYIQKFIPEEYKESIKSELKL